MTVSVLGLGAMGARMARKLLDAGHTVTVWNRSDGPAGDLHAHGASVADSPAEAAAASDLVLTMLTDDEASQAVWAPALDGLGDGTLAVEMSTLTPDRARALAAAVRSRGARFLDAPVVGTRPHVEAGQLTVLVGGDAAALDTARPAFEAFAGAIHHVGPAGAGMAMKLAVNALFAIQAAALAELTAGLAAEGIDRATSTTFLAQMPTSSPVAARVGALMAEGRTAPNFPIDLVAKDLRYAQSLADTAGVPSHAVAGAAQAFADASGAGFDDLDIAGIARLYPTP
ncbi:MAG: NAD(P)-dependent oxidoreductase [Bacteroidota bacterium]